MKTVNAVTIIFYTTDTGNQPFVNWQQKLDNKTESITGKKARALLCFLSEGIRAVKIAML